MLHVCTSKNYLFNCVFVGFRLNPKPSLLIGHFFAVVVYAMYFAFRTRPVWQWPFSAYNAACIFLNACIILFPLVWSEMKTVVMY